MLKDYEPHEITKGHKIAKGQDDQVTKNYNRSITNRQLLSDVTEKKRFKRSKPLLSKLRDNAQLQILETDVNLFSVQVIYNNQNYRI